MQHNNIVQVRAFLEMSNFFKISKARSTTTTTTCATRFPDSIDARGAVAASKHYTAPPNVSGRGRARCIACSSYGVLLATRKDCVLVVVNVHARKLY